MRVSTPLDRKKVITTSIKAEAVGKAIVVLITTSTDNSGRITCRLVISSSYRAIGIVAGRGHDWYESKTNKGHSRHHHKLGAAPETTRD